MTASDRKPKPNLLLLMPDADAVAVL